jgi:hypothetical protein
MVNAGGSMQKTLKSEAALDELSTSDASLGNLSDTEPASVTTTRQRVSDFVTLCGLRGYTVQIDHLVACIDQADETPMRWVVDNLAVDLPLSESEVSRLISLVWQQKRLHGAKIAWVTKEACGADARALLSLPIKVRIFRTVKGARAWLRGKS